MKYIFFIITLLTTQFIIAANVDSLFIKGNEAYKQGQYKDALEHYHAIEERGYASPELYFNLANTYYKENNIAPAIYYYEKALKLNPGMEDARGNLKIARRMTLDRFDPMPETFFQKLAGRYLYRHHSDFWAYLSVIFVVLFAVLFLYYYFSTGVVRKKTSLIASLVSLGLFLIFTFFTIKTYLHRQHLQPAVIFEHQVSVRAEPSPASEALFDLHEGTKVWVENHDGNWCKVRLPNGNTGWLPCESFRKI